MSLHSTISHVLAMWVTLLYVGSSETHMTKSDFCLKVHIQLVRHHCLYISSVLQTIHISNQKDDLFILKSVLFILFHSTMSPALSSKL